MIKALILGLVLVAQPKIYKEPALVGHGPHGEHVLVNPAPRNATIELNCGLDYEEVEVEVPSKTKLTVTIQDQNGKGLYCWFVGYRIPE
jgi:hypothetical protein